VSCEGFIVLWTLLKTTEEVEAVGIAACVVVVFCCCGDFVAYFREVFGEILAS
jgi:hypothetical protein